METSQFEKIVPEDSKQFNNMLSKFKDVSLVDFDGLEELTKKALILATRWSDIQSNAVKIASDFGVNKTDFSTWAYQRYRQLEEMHTSCRGWHRSAKEDYRTNQIVEGRT